MLLKRAHKLNNDEIQNGDNRALCYHVELRCSMVQSVSPASTDALDSAVTVLSNDEPNTVMRVPPATGPLRGEN